MGMLSDLGGMKYPFGRCACCGEVFDAELRSRRSIVCCPYCGTKIDDFLSFVDSEEESERRLDLFCDDCGRRVFETKEDGVGGDWIDDCAGVCGDGCGRELCGRCGGWDEDTGLCRDCRDKLLGQTRHGGGHSNGKERRE